MRLPHDGTPSTGSDADPDAGRDEVDAELEFHLECRVQGLVASGVDPDSARREASRRFGDRRRFARECRLIAASRRETGRRASLGQELFQDLGGACKRLLREPGFALATVSILALGIGAATALFSVADPVVFRSLPFPQAERLVWIDETTPEGDRFSTSLLNLLDWRRASRAFSGLAGFELRTASLDLTGAGDGEPRRILTAPVTEDFFDLLGMRPAEGRLLPAEAFAPGADHDWAVLSHGLWSAAFAASPDAVGGTILVDGRPTRVAGVLPPGFAFPEGAELWTPLREDRFERDEKEIAAIGRLAPGVTLEAGEAELRNVALRLGALHPEANRGWSVELRSLQDAIVGPQLSRAFLVLLGAVGVLSLIACVNVSGLLLARGTARSREMAIRASLGAPRSRLVRQLLAEALVIGSLGGLAGLLVAWAVIGGVRLWGPAAVPGLAHASLDGRVLAFSAAAALVSSVLSGLLPALRTSSTRPSEALRAGGRAATGATARLRSVLVVAQLALAVTLLVGAALSATSFVRLLEVDVGFDTEDVLAVRIDLPELHYPVERRRTLAREIRAELSSLAGVVNAAASVGAPYAGFFTANQVAVAGWEPDPSGGYPVVQWRSVTPGYFDVLDVPVLRGRPITDEDRADGNVVVVNRAFAALFWPGDDAVGREVGFGGPEGSPRIVIGVVGDVRDSALEEPPRPTLYIPYQDTPWVHQTWLVEAAAAPAAVAPAVRAALRRLAPGVPIPELRPLAANLGEARLNPRFQAWLMAAFGLVAVALAAAGVYGLIAYTVAGRTREIGIRMALGARPGAVVAMVARRGAALVAAGAALGVAGALGLARSLESLLYDTAPSEATLYVVSVAVLALVGLVASYLPARRAADVDPTAALAAE